MADVAPLSFIPPLQITNTPKTYPAVGRCIYCRTGTGRLTLEHILPFGIAGDSLMLPASSCKSCARITGRIENECLRHMWWPFRTRIGAPTSKPKDRPATFKLRKVRREETGEFLPVETLELKSEDFPVFYVALKLHPPGIISNRPPTHVLEGEMFLRANEEEVRKHTPETDDGMFLAPINPTNFCRMLAKIAYSYAVAEVGYGNFRPLVLKLIKGKSRTPNFWVGGEWVVPPVSENFVLHDLRRGVAEFGGKRYVFVDIRLFDFFETPLYRVVVGEL